MLWIEPNSMHPRDEPTSSFLTREGKAGIEAIVNPAITLLTQDAWLSRLCRIKDSMPAKVGLSMMDFVLVPLERKFGITAAMRQALYDRIGSSRKRSALAHMLKPVIDASFAGWQKRQASGAKLAHQPHRVEPLPDLVYIDIK